MLFVSEVTRDTCWQEPLLCAVKQRIKGNVPHTWPLSESSWKSFLPTLLSFPWNLMSENRVHPVTSYRCQGQFLLCPLSMHLHEGKTALKLCFTAHSMSKLGIEKNHLIISSVYWLILTWFSTQIVIHTCHLCCICSARKCVSQTC